MPHHPVFFGIFLYFSIVNLGWLIWLVRTEYKNRRNISAFYYYSDDLPPLTREQFIEMSGEDPVTLMHNQR